MPTFRHGKFIRVFYGNGELGTSLKSLNMVAAVDTAETTAFGSTVKTYVIGIPGQTLSFQGMFSAAAATDIDPVLNAGLGQELPTPITIALDSGVTAGKQVKGGLSHDSNYSISGSVSDMVGVNVDFQLTDVAGSGLVLQTPDTPVALTGVAANGVGQDYTVYCTGGGGTTMVNGGVAIVHVLANTVNASTTLNLQSATTLGGTYSTFATFSAIGATTTTSASVAVTRGTTVNKFIRWQISATGTGNLTFLTYFIPSMV